MITYDDPYTEIARLEDENELLRDALNAIADELAEPCGDRWPGNRTTADRSFYIALDTLAAVGDEAAVRLKSHSTDTLVDGLKIKRRP